MGISGSYSAPTRSAAGIFQEAKIPYLSAYAIHPDITKAGDYVFRTSFLGEVQGRAGAKLIGDILGKKRVVIITLKNDFGKSLAAGYKKVRHILLSFASVNRAREMKKAMEFLHMLGIEQYKDQEVSKLPLGVLIRLEVARALAIEPKVLLLDEPLAGLNSQEAGKLADTVKSISRQGMTIVMIEHNLSEVLRISDRLQVSDSAIVLESGNTVWQGSSQEARASSSIIDSILGLQKTG